MSGQEVIKDWKEGTERRATERRIPNVVAQFSIREVARLAEQVRVLLPALAIAYTILADIRHDWAGRHTAEGQGALCAMRDAICTATGRDPQDVQDEYTNARLAATAPRVSAQQEGK